MAVLLEGAIKRWIGLSSDTKPAPGQTQFDPTLNTSTPLVALDVPPGSSFLETDTGFIYRWNGDQWMRAPDSSVTAAQFLGAVIEEVKELRDTVELAASATQRVALNKPLTAPVFSTSIESPLGIATGAAYADLDAIGSFPFSFVVPPSGIIQSASDYDRDDEGLQVDLWLFDAPPAQQTDNSAFALADTDLDRVIDVIQFVGFRDAANGQVSTQNGLGIAYNVGAPGIIYALLQARGALNIAAGALPGFRLRILPD